MKQLVKFVNNFQYNEVEYLLGHVYEIEDTPKGFIRRWEKRGNVLIEDEKDLKDGEKIYKDPRFTEGKLELLFDDKQQELPLEEHAKEVLEEVPMEEPKLVKPKVTKKKARKRASKKEIN